MSKKTPISRSRGKYFHCKKCGYQFAKLLNKNTIVLYGKKGEQFIINFARAQVVCPNPQCGAQQTIESPMVKDVEVMIKKIYKAKTQGKEGKGRLRLKSDFIIHGLKSFDELRKIFPSKDIKFDPVWTKRFVNLLPEQQRKVYRIMVDNFDGEVWSRKVLSIMEKELSLPQVEAEKVYVKVLEKIGKVKGYKQVESDNLFDFIRKRWWDDER
jgi:hypothetical protein